MNLQQLERTVIVTIGTRLTLVAIAIANFDKAAWSFSRWSESAAWQADIMAGCIESALVIFTYMLAQRLIANAKKMKSDPEQPTRTLWAFVILLSLLSAFCNAMYFVHFGRLADPLENIRWSAAAGVVLGIAAPILAGGIAYLQGEEAATEIAVREAKDRREEIKRKAEETRRLKRLKKAETEVKAEIEEQHSTFSQWTTAESRLDMIVKCVQELDPVREGVTREDIIKLIYDGRKASDSTKYADISGLLKVERLTTKNGLITWPEAVRSF